MKLNKLIKKINKENTPPDGWKAEDGVLSVEKNYLKTSDGKTKIDPFGFNKAINWDKLEDPEVLKQLEEIFDEENKT